MIMYWSACRHAVEARRLWWVLFKAWNTYDKSFSYKRNLKGLLSYFSCRVWIDLGPLGQASGCRSADKDRELLFKFELSLIIHPFWHVPWVFVLLIFCLPISSFVHFYTVCLWTCLTKLSEGHDDGNINHQACRIISFCPFSCL